MYTQIIPPQNRACPLKYDFKQKFLVVQRIREELKLVYFSHNGFHKHRFISRSRIEVSLYPLIVFRKQQKSFADRLPQRSADLFNSTNSQKITETLPTIHPHRSIFFPIFYVIHKFLKLLNRRQRGTSSQESSIDINCSLRVGVTKKESQRSGSNVKYAICHLYASFAEPLFFNYKCVMRIKCLLQVQHSNQRIGRTSSTFIIFSFW